MLELLGAANNWTPLFMKIVTAWHNKQFQYLKYKAGLPNLEECTCHCVALGGNVPDAIVQNL